MTTSRTLSLILAVTLAESGCQESAPHHSPVTSPSVQNGMQWELPAAPQLDSRSSIGQDTDSISDEDALALGYEVEDALRSQDLDAFMARFDVGYFQRLIHWEPLKDPTPAKTTTKQTRVHQVIDQEAQESIREALRSILRFAMESESLSLVGVRETTRGNRLLFRVIGRGEAVTYFEVCYGRSDDELCVIDVYLHPLAESLSDTLRADVVTADIQLEIQDMKRWRDLRERMAAARSKDAQELVKLYEEMPWDEKSRRRCLIPLLLAAPSLGDIDFAMAVAEARKHFPNDVQVNLSLIWAYESRDEALEALEPLDRACEGVDCDPFLLAWKAGFLLGAGRNDEAKTTIEALLAEPLLDWETAHSLLWNCLERKDYPQATKVMDLIRRDFEASAVDQIELNGFAEFTESPEYKSWLAAQERN